MTSRDSQMLRNNRGEFATLRGPVDLCEIVREVAILAAKHDDDPLKDPARVSQHACELERFLRSVAPGS